MNRISRYTLIAAGIACLLVSCASRYKLDFYLLDGEKRAKVDIEQTQYAPMTVLASPYAEAKVVQGLGNTLMIGTGARGAREQKTSQYDVFGFDEYLRYRIYIQLPISLQKGIIPLQGNSFVEAMGRYDRPAEQNIYSPASGNLVVDSIVSKHLFVTVEKGVFTNSAGGTVSFEGRAKVRVAN